MDFRPPIIKNIGAAFASVPITLSAVFFMLAADIGLLSLPLHPALFAVNGLLIAGSVLLFCLHGTGKNKEGMRRGVLFWNGALFAILAVAALAAVGAYLLYPQFFPTELLKKVLGAAYIGENYQKWFFIVAALLVAFCCIGIWLAFGAVRRTMRDGIPRYKGLLWLCLLIFITAVVVGYPIIMYTLDKDFQAVIRFGELLPYNFVSALCPMFCLLGSVFLSVALLKYSGAVKRSNNV